jgi:hypothetical protein
MPRMRVTTPRRWTLYALVLASAQAWAQSQPPPRPPGAASGPAQPHHTPEEDGSDDPEASGTGTLPATLRLEFVGRAPTALTRICDLAPFGDSLYAAHAHAPLARDGATIIRYTPGGPSPFTVAFDWNRPGQTRRGVGAGRGFVRIRTIDGRLYVPDADPPGAGFGYSFPRAESYVFVSDAQGRFAPARSPRFQPPAAPTATSAGAMVLPRAHHVFDVIRFRGHLYASTGAVPPGQDRGATASPGALFLADTTDGAWRYLIDYPNPRRPGTWRFGYMTRFRERIYLGLEQSVGRGAADYLWALPPAGAASITGVDLHPERVTPSGGALTLRWYADHGRLYWIAYDRAQNVSTLRVTEDGDHWSQVTFPPDGGHPTDVTRFRDGLVVLTTRGLWRIDGSVPTRLAVVPRDPAGEPFELGDPYCAAPLAVYRNALYAGGQRDGGLYRFID